MDRLEFMESLNTKIKELEEKESKLSNECSDAYLYTTEYLKLLLQPSDDQVSTLNDAKLNDEKCYSTIINNGNGIFLSDTQSFKYNNHEVVSDGNSTEIIIKLSSRIKELEDSCDSLENKLNKYKNDDIRKKLPYLS